MYQFCDCEYGTIVMDYSIYYYMCGVVNAYYRYWSILFHARRDVG
jgi:hypothetical protein